MHLLKLLITTRNSLPHQNKKYLNKCFHTIFNVFTFYRQPYYLKLYYPNSDMLQIKLYSYYDEYCLFNVFTQAVLQIACCLWRKIMPPEGV